MMKAIVCIVIMLLLVPSGFVFAEPEQAAPQAKEPPQSQTAPGEEPASVSKQAPSTEPTTGELPNDPQPDPLPTLEPSENAVQESGDTEPSSLTEEDEPDVVIEYAEEAVAEDRSTREDVSLGATTERIVRLSGVLLERGTKKPLADITVYLQGTDHQTMSDTQGRFEFFNLPPGSYTVNIPTTGYEPFKTEEEIRETERTEVVYYMEPRIYGQLEVVVHGQKVRKEVSRKVITMREAKVIPGTQGDAVKVVQNLPGVARGGTSSDGVVMRGSNAEDSKIFLDGHEIPILFHFGGLKSVYNSELLADIDVTTGGFGAQWGNATGGIVELKSRAPRTDRWGGYVDTSFIDVSAMAEGPLTEDMGLALAVRRSTIDLMMPFVMSGMDDVSFTTYPVYYDYQAKWDWQINKENSLRLDVYGSVDQMKLGMDAVDDSEPEFTGSLGMDTQFHAFISHWRYDNGTVENDFSPGYSAIMGHFNIGRDIYIDNNAHVFDIQDTVRMKVNETNTLGMGVLLQPRLMQLKANVVRPPKEGEVQKSFSNEEKIHTNLTESDLIGSFHFFDELQLGPVLLVPGLRLDYESYLNIAALSPRLTARYQVVKPLVLKASGGLYHRTPDADEMVQPFGNKGLEFERAVHAVLGLEWNITDVINLDVQGYYKYMDNLVSAIQNPVEGSNRYYENGGKGYVYGGEIMLRHNWTENFFGWISYSISQSMRTDGPGTPYRLFDMDQTHNLVVVASWQFAKGWRLGGRFQFTSGEPYTDIYGSVFNADNGTYTPLYNERKKNGKRTEPYHKLDIRLDKEWRFDTWMLTGYLDIQGAYYHANEVGTTYNYDYSEKGSFRDLPILPSIGLKAEF